MSDIEHAAGSLAVRADQAFWTDEQRAVLAQMGADSDVTNAELAAFLHVCQRRRLDPFTRQIYLIGRWDKREQRKVFNIQTSIDGFRLIARRAADASGIDYEYEDTLYYAPDGTVHTAWLWESPPAAVKVVVVRNGRRYDAVARYAAYVQTNKDGNPTGQWRTMPDTMTAKCAEALALRKAFPEDLGGLYTSDEMGQADNPERVIQGQAMRAESPRLSPALSQASPPPGPSAEPTPESAPADGQMSQAAQRLLVEAEEAATVAALGMVWTAITALLRSGEISRPEADRVRDRVQELKAQLIGTGAEVTV